MWVTAVASDFDVFCCEVVDVVDVRVEVKLRPRVWVSRQKLLYLINMVFVDVKVAEGVDEHSGGVACQLSYHRGENGVACDVVGSPYESVCAPLVELTV